MESAKDIIKHIESLVKAMQGPDYNLNSSKLTARDVIRMRKVRARLEECLLLWEHDFRYDDEM